MKYLRNSEGLDFNPKHSTIIHIDLNSCFASIEQQANPHLRGKPVAVAAYTTPYGCIIAPSVEAKKLGIRVGMRVKDGKMICPNLIILSPDPWKYRNVHLALKNLLSSYTRDLVPKSIDEFVLDLEGYPCFSKGMENVAREIKREINKKVGDWIKVSIGIAPNRYLAKLAAGLKKPDGLEEICKNNFQDVYSHLLLTDLPWIKVGNAARLNNVGVFSVSDFYNAPISLLRAAFNSILAYYWYLRLRGWEIDDVEFGRRSYGNSYALPKPLEKSEDLSPILAKLVEKMSFRLRRAGLVARGIHVAISFRNGSFWHKGVTYSKSFFDSRDIYKEAFRIMLMSCYKGPVRDLAVSCFDLRKNSSLQLEFFDDMEKKMHLSKSLDEVNERWGNFVITPARMMGTKENVPDRIAFGGVKELEEFTLRS